jgi:hypothetical protein
LLFFQRMMRRRPPSASIPLETRSSDWIEIQPPRYVEVHNFRRRSVDYLHVK